MHAAARRRTRLIGLQFLSRPRALDHLGHDREKGPYSCSSQHGTTHTMSVSPHWSRMRRTAFAAGVPSQLLSARLSPVHLMRRRQTVAGKHLCGAVRKRFPRQGGNRPFPRRLSEDVPSRGGHDIAVAKYARGCQSTAIVLSVISSSGATCQHGSIYTQTKVRFRKMGPRLLSCQGCS